MYRVLLATAARAGRQASNQSTRSHASGTISGSVANLGLRRAAALTFGSGLGFYAATNDDVQRVAFSVSSVPLRLARDAWTVAAILADYKWSLRSLSGKDYELEIHHCHTRGANRLLDLCRANGGIYIKLGQHLGMLDHLLPAEYVQTMRAHLLDRCPVSPWSHVRKNIQEDLGAPLEEFFSAFNPTPVASASLAQVHIAVDRATNTRVAVKVQHRGLRETSKLDLLVIEGLVRSVRFFAPDVDYMWLVEEANENLPNELNFKIEAANAERCAANLASKQCRSSRGGRVVVPAIDHGKTTHRVLTMEYIDGVKVTDLAGLRKLRAKPSSVAKLISQTFNEMIFVFGDVHADPHAANILVRATPEGIRIGQPWQLVLLDHGLYRRLDDDFRISYASLWRSLIFADGQGLTNCATKMGAGGAVPLFAGMLTQKPWEQVSRKRRGTERLKLQYTEEERQEIQLYAGMYAKEIGDLLAKIPRELLLLLKTNDCLRAVDMALGAGVNNYIITARECTRALAEHRSRALPGWRSKMVAATDAARLEARLMALRTLTWVDPVWKWVGWMWGGVEDQEPVMDTMSGGEFISDASLA